jgi:hypothetical protein
MVPAGLFLEDDRLGLGRRFILIDADEDASAIYEPSEYAETLHGDSGHVVTFIDATLSSGIGILDLSGVANNRAKAVAALGANANSTTEDEVPRSQPRCCD